MSDSCPATLVVRADASSAIGTGHVMRSLALAQAWQDAGGRTVFVSSKLPMALAERIADDGCELHRLTHPIASDEDAAATIRFAQEASASWVAADGYRFTPKFFETLRSTGLRVMAIDDMAHLERYPVNLLLNQNLSANRELYHGKCEPETELLLGPHYCLLRREFRRTLLARTPFSGRAKRVLVTFGGSDPDNCTAAVLAQLAQQPGNLEVIVLAGATNPHVATLQSAALHAPFACEVRVGVRDVAALMAWADVAITAGGSTVWELAAMQLPALIGAISEDQRMIGPPLNRIASFRALPIEQLLRLNLMKEIDALLAAPRDFAGLDAAGALRVVAEMTD